MEDSDTYRSASEARTPVHVSTDPDFIGAEAALRRAAAKAVARDHAAGMEPVVRGSEDDEEKETQ